LTEARQEDPVNPRVAVMLAQAQAAAGETEAALTTLESLPPEEQEKPEIKRVSGQLFFAAVPGVNDDPGQLATRLETTPEDSATRYALAARQVLQGQVDDAAENLLTIIQKDRQFGDDAGRRALLKLFDLLGEDPVVNRYRARLFNLLH
jgi:putative thioredoxin